MPTLDSLFTAGGFLKWDGAGNADADYSSQSASDLAADAAFTGAFVASEDGENFTWAGNPVDLGGGGASTPAASFAWGAMHRLDTDAGNVVIGVTGDSISTDTTEWVGKLAGKLATQFPKFTVTLKNKTNGADSYTADVTVQTGTGGNGNTLTIYNWSQSGAATGVGLDSDTVLETAFPVAPDLLLIATGHNDSADITTTYPRMIRGFIRRFSARWPLAHVAFVLMNPKTSAHASYNAQFLREEAKVRIAGDLGLGILDLHTAWLDRAGGYADLMADTLHPNDDGHEFLASTAYSRLLAALDAPPGNARRRRITDQVFVPLAGGMAAVGSPVLALQGGYSNTFGVAFDPDAAEETWICPPVELPEWWNAFQVEIDWCPQVATGGDAYFEVRYSILLPGSTAGLSYVHAAACTAPASAQGKPITASFLSSTPGHTIPDGNHLNGKSNGPVPPLTFRVKRIGTNAGDTLAGDALVFGLRLIRTI